MEPATDPEVFAPQVELGIRINGVLRDWLLEQIDSAIEPEGSHQ